MDFICELDVACCRRRVVEWQNGRRGQGASWVKEGQSDGIGIGCDDGYIVINVWDDGYVDWDLC